MTIRPAKFGDITRMAELMTEMHQKSIYADRCGLDIKLSKALFFNCIQKHGHLHEGGARVVVAEKAGQVEGFLIGMLERVYHVGDKLMATDLFFCTSEAADPRDASRLIDDFLKWAKGNPAVVEVLMGVTNAIGDYSRAEKLYSRKGLSRCGVMYEGRVEHVQSI